MKTMIHNGVPNDQRGQVILHNCFSTYGMTFKTQFWSLYSGAVKNKNNWNSNSETGSYFNELVEKNKKSLAQQQQQQQVAAAAAVASGTNLSTFPTSNISFLTSAYEIEKVFLLILIFKNYIITQPLM